MTHAYNHRPCGTPMQSARGVRSTIEGEIFKGTDGACADPGPRIFPATGHKTAVPPSSFISLTFTSHTGSLLLSLYAPRYCLTASAGFGRRFVKSPALSRLGGAINPQRRRRLRLICAASAVKQLGEATKAAIPPARGAAVRLLPMSFSAREPQAHKKLTFPMQIRFS